MTRAFRLHLLPGSFTIVHLDRSSSIPDWASEGELFSATRTADELSIVCDSALVPEGTARSDGWSALKVEGPLDFDEIGVIASLGEILAAAEISLFVISTWNTDYLMVRRDALERAIEHLEASGHSVTLQQSGDSNV
ncbi:MAG: ACT domain-containing protein [Thermoanaerobaculia bacterium]|nr:ACT domain-containing protein [Thermoanaerobaculia bacterium]